MSWNITVSHEEVGERTRMVIEADRGVPELVISAVAASYWEEEVRFADEWDEDDFEELDDGLQGPGGLHG